MDLFESVNKLLQDKHTLTEAKTVLRVTFDNGMKKDIEFKGSFEAGKKAYLGKNVKAMSKDKTPVMLKAVKVEPINEGTTENEIDIANDFPAILQNIENILKNPPTYFGAQSPIEYTFPKSERYNMKVVKAFCKYFQDKGYKVEVGTDKPLALYFNRDIVSKINKSLKESNDLEPMKTFKVTYHDGSSYKTSARAKSAEDFKKYLTQDGPWIVTGEDYETGKETKKKIVNVEMLKESKDEEKYFQLNDLKKLLISKDIGIENWNDRDGTPGYTLFLKTHNGKHAQFTKPLTKEEFEKLQKNLLNLVSDKIWKLDDMRNFIKNDKDLVNKVECVEFIKSGPGEYDSEDNFFIFKNKETGKEFTLSEPMNNKELKSFFLKKLNH